MYVFIIHTISVHNGVYICINILLLYTVVGTNLRHDILLICTHICDHFYILSKKL